MRNVRSSKKNKLWIKIRRLGEIIEKKFFNLVKRVEFFTFPVKGHLFTLHHDVTH